MNMHVESDRKSNFLWFGNSLVNIKVECASGADEISIIEQWLPYGDATPLHVHRRQDEIFHLIAGQMRFRVGENEITAQAGDTLLAPKGVPHCFVVESLQGVHCLAITKGTDFESMVKAASRPAVRPELPVAIEPTPDMIARLVACCVAHQIDILGPPISLAKDAGSGSNWDADIGADR